MKVTCGRPAIAAGLRQAVVLASNSDRKPLQCVKIEADSALTLLATDGQTSLRFVVPRPRIERKGQVLVPAAPLEAVLESMTGPTVTFDSTGDDCLITGANSTFRLSSQPSGQFPAVPQFDAQDAVELKAETLRRMVRYGSFAADTLGGSRYVLDSTLWEMDEREIVVVSTDGRRLAAASGSLSSKASPARALCSRKLMSLLEDNLPANDDSVFVRFSDSDIRIHSGSSVWIAALVEGRFPQYKEVLTTRASRKVTLDVAGFRSALRQVTAISAEPVGYVLLTLDGKAMKLTHRDEGIGEAQVRISVDMTGEPIRIALNPQFLLDALGVLEEKTAVLELSAPDHAAVIRVPGFTYVVMPVEVQ